MNNCQNMIDKITEHISSMKDRSYILIGDNSSGKSEVLRRIVEKEIDKKIYFVDSVNRTFDVNKVSLVSKAYNDMKMESKEVISERIAPFNFNLRDTFKVATCIEQLYNKYCIQINALSRAFLGKDFQIEREILEAGLAENKVVMDGKEIKLSSGYQAIIRIFCEILFFCDVMNDKGWNRGVVVIDEIDEYLSPRHSAEILNFLQKQFSNISFCVTTHSLDLVENSHNADLIILRDSEYEIYTRQQLEGIVSADDIFAKLFFEDKMIHESSDDEIDERLRVLLNMKIAGLWDEEAQSELKKLGEEKILPHQRMIYKQIEEW